MCAGTLSEGLAAVGCRPSKRDEAVPHDIVLAFGKLEKKVEQFNNNHVRVIEPYSDDVTFASDLPLSTPKSARLGPLSTR